MLLLLTGCVKILMLAQSMHSPREMSDEKLERFAKKWHIDRSRSYTLSAEGHHIIVDSEHGLQIPDLWIFDPQGRSVHYGDPKECKQNTISWLEQVTPGQEHTYDPIHLDDLTQHFRTAAGDVPTALPDPSAADFTLIMNWAHFGGTLNSYIEDWQMLVEKNPDVKFQIYYLNIDPQNSETNSEK